MRKGLLDVLPKNALEDLTAEDFRLLVNGCGEVNVQMLISFTSFNDESGTTTMSTSVILSYLCFLHLLSHERMTVLHFWVNILSRGLFFIQQGRMLINFSSLNAGFGP